MLVARLVELWKKNLLSWFAKNLYCENSAGFSKAAPETHKYTLRFTIYDNQKNCIYLLNKFRRNSYLEKSVQNSKKGWVYVTYDDRLSILGQRNSHTPLDIICSMEYIVTNLVNFAVHCQWFHQIIVIRQGV